MAAIYRYPVKSMASEAVDAVEVSWNGLAGDRRWAFIREGMARSGFPWLTIRENAAMWRYQPRFGDPSEPDTSVTVVRTPAGSEMDVVDPALAEELGSGARAIKQNRGIFDTMPVSLITTQTVAHVGCLVGVELDARRFRPNLVIEASPDSPFQEVEWVGEIIQIGQLKLHVNKRDKRCVMVNVDPATTDQNPAILRAIARECQAQLGVYASTVEPGRVAVGDQVILAN
ncbi:MAG: MOSC domain-containing protein [Gemmatimonadaceae bacterium]